jgi:Holliday junction resolvase RusA-like endonuclease
MSSFTVFVPGRPVSANAMYGFKRAGRGKGKLYLTTEAAVWEEAVRYEVLAKLGARALRPPVTVSYRFTGIRADVDNLLKTTTDGLKHALGIDDRHFQIAGAVVEPGGEPGVWLTIADFNTLNGS